MPRDLARNSFHLCLRIPHVWPLPDVLKKPYICGSLIERSKIDSASRLETAVGSMPSIPNDQGISNVEDEQIGWRSAPYEARILHGLPERTAEEEIRGHVRVLVLRL